MKEELINLICEYGGTEFKLGMVEGVPAHLIDDEKYQKETKELREKIENIFNKIYDLVYSR